MEKVIIVATYIIVFIVGLIIGLNIYNKYDVNRDNEVNAKDYIDIRNYIMKEEK